MFFLIPDLTELRVVRLQRDAVACALLSYFRGVGNKTTVEHFLKYFKEHLPHPDLAQAFLSRLANAGIVVEYLVKDLRRFGGDLAGLVPELDDKIELLGRHHLSSTTPERLVAAHSELQGCNLPRTEKEPDLYYVNSYCSANLQPYLPSIEKVSEQFRRLVPLLTLKNNFSANAEVLRRYLTERLDGEPGKQLPLLRVASDFLRYFDANVARHQPVSGVDDGNSTDAGLPELAMMTNNISDSELRHLVHRFSPGKPTGEGCA